MNTPVSLSIEPSLIKLMWTPLSTDAETGRDPISYYKVEWDQYGDGNWVSLTSEGGSLMTSYSHNAPTGQIFQANVNFKYRLIAKNTLGYGLYSDALTITTDNIPQFMNIPTATLVSPKQVDLKWTVITADADTGRDPVIYYKVEMLSRPCYTTTDDCAIESLGLATWVEVSAEASQGAKNTFSHVYSAVLKPAEYYFYRVCPKNRVGYGSCSEEYSFMSD
jgi:hypothetical protein